VTTVTTVTTSGIWSSVNVALPDLKGLNTPSIRWGHPASRSGKQSGYRFDGGTVLVVDDGSEFTLGTFTHENFVVSGVKQSYFQVILKVIVTFDEGDLTREFSVPFNHTETPNVRGLIPDEVDLPTLNSPETVTIENSEYAVVISGFKHNGGIVTKFISAENGANSADIVAQLEAL
jgi:hypothetical protein